MLRTNRGLLKYLLLSIVTLGIYGLVVMFNVSRDINTIASSRDGKHTMNYLLIFFLLSWLTLGIAPLVWFHKISNRIGNQLLAVKIPYSFSAGTFWGWYICGSLLFGVGPLVYLHKFFKAMNLIADDYNKSKQ